MLNGVHSSPLSTDTTRVERCRHIYHALLDQHCFYRAKENGQTIPWLISEMPWPLPRDIQAQLNELGVAVFTFFDSLQSLYKARHAQVVKTLYLGVSEALRGLQISKFMQLFRLDTIVANNQVYITEIEEVFGGIGTLAAMEKAYKIDYGNFFKMMERLENQPSILPFSCLTNSQKGKAWRFCYTKDFSQYSKP